jgi:hypothetical protein
VDDATNFPKSDLPQRIIHALPGEANAPARRLRLRRSIMDFKQPPVIFRNLQQSSVTFGNLQ